MIWDIWTRNLWAWPLATMEMWRRAFDLDPCANSPGEGGPQWSTPNRLTLELDSLRLWDFSVGAAPPAVVVSPFALHDAQIADLAPGHSLVAALLRHGCSRLSVVEWKSATPATQSNNFDDQLAALNVAIDDAGAPVDLIGLCQGGWLSLVYATRFTAKVRRVVAVGAPVDVKAEASILSEPVESTPDSAIDGMIEHDGGVVTGRRMAKVWPREPTEEQRLVDALQIEDPLSSSAAQPVVDAFQRWDRRTLDLPGPYYRDVVRNLYRDNLLARGAFPALGRRVDLRSLNRPVFLLAGENDCIAPLAQAFAAARLVSGAAETAVAPCGHLALFMGRRTIEEQWPRIARWLAQDQAA